MVDIEEANAYKEVLCVIKNLTLEDYNKIPNDYKIFLETNCNKEYDFEYDNLKPFSNQMLSEKAKYILFGFFEKFGATEEQKKKIKSYKSNYNKNLEELKSRKYSPDNIFKKKMESNINDIKKKQENLSLEKYEENKWYKKFFSIIKKFFKKK